MTHVVRRMQSDDEHEKDGSSSFSTATSSPSSVVESDLMKMIVDRNDEMVTVNNNCVNIDKEMQLKNIEDKKNNLINNEKEIVISVAASAVALDEIDRQLNNDDSLAVEKNQKHNNDDDLLIITNLNLDHDDHGDNDIKNGDDDDDDDALTTSSSKYSDVVYSRCEVSSTSALPHVAHYTPTIDNNRNHRKAVRKNFSLWIGVTSCVWACLVWLMKNYA